MIEVYTTPSLHELAARICTPGDLHNTAPSYFMGLMAGGDYVRSYYRRPSSTCAIQYQTGDG